MGILGCPGANHAGRRRGKWTKVHAFCGLVASGSRRDFCVPLRRPRWRSVVEEGFVGDRILAIGRFDLLGCNILSPRCRFRLLRSIQVGLSLCQRSRPALAESSRSRVRDSHTPALSSPRRQPTPRAIEIDRHPARKLSALRSTPSSGSNATPMCLPRPRHNRRRSGVIARWYLPDV